MKSNINCLSDGNPGHPSKERHLLFSLVVNLYHPWTWWQMYDVHWDFAHFVPVKMHFVDDTFSARTFWWTTACLCYAMEIASTYSMKLFMVSKTWYVSAFNINQIRGGLSKTFSLLEKAIMVIGPWEIVGCIVGVLSLFLWKMKKNCSPFSFFTQETSVECLKNALNNYYILSWVNLESRLICYRPRSSLF